jgi:hypothetical protein
VALLSHSGVDERHPAQRHAWWVLAYESEVQNSGHDAFLEHVGEGAGSTIKALYALGARVHADVLAEAIARRMGTDARGQDAPDLADFDAAYAAVSPTLADTLERYFREHQGDFVLAASAPT